MTSTFARSSLVCALALLAVQQQQQNTVAAIPIATISNDSAASINTTVVTDGLIGWFDCSALTYSDQSRIGSSFLPDGDWDFYSGTNSLSSYAKRAQCAQYQAPLCHKSICEDAQARTIDVFVKRVLARNQSETKPNVWFFQGGPGAASPTMEYGMRALYVALEGNVNVYTMDHRGTGRSTPLDCIAAQAATSASPFGADIDISEYAACAQELQSTYGDMAAFSVTSAATDIASFIAKYQPGSKTYVYGVSYGSMLVERLIHLNTTEIVGYILDGVATTSGAAVSDGMYMSNWDVNFGEVADHFFDLLKTNAPKTSRKFGSKSVSSVLKSALADLDKSPHSRCAKVFTSFYDPTGAATMAKTSKPSYYVHRFLGNLLRSKITREYIPVMVYRLSRCNEDDSEVLAHAVNAITELLSAPSEEDALVSVLEYYLVVFSELWEDPTPSYDTLMSRYENASIGSGNAAAILPLYCAFTKDTSAACSAVVNATMTGSGPALAYKKDKYWNVAATIPPQASVLILSGKLDPQTPHKYAERLFKAMDGAKKELVAFEYAEHGALLSATYGGKLDSYGFPTSPRRYCAVELLASYVQGNANLSKLNKTCVAVTNDDMSLLDPIQVYEYTFLNTRDDMFDGEFDNYYYTTKLETPLIIVSTTSGFLAVGLLITVCIKVSNRRAARATEQWRMRANGGVTASPTTATSFLPRDGDPTATSTNAPAETRV